VLCISPETLSFYHQIDYLADISAHAEVTADLYRHCRCINTILPMESDKKSLCHQGDTGWLNFLCTRGTAIAVLVQ
jgi:hypothetical protein